ncbi:response regulator [Rhizobium terrae]|uniref:response regulator n=1 Tax=Rhizobium terrae TaxID=2171756 RepID=UPI000E3C08B0|nr:response regulator [Rhizobium terrae]
MPTHVMRRWLASEAMNQRVLIVEDEFLIALDVAETIENMGLKVAGFAAARQHALALAAYADIAIVDVNLSDGRTGPEIGRELAEQYGVTVIFMTANPEDVEDGVKGPLGVLTKPVMPEVVEKTIDYAIASRLGGMVAVPRELRVFRQDSH